MGCSAVLPGRPRLVTYPSAWLLSTVGARAAPGRRCGARYAAVGRHAWPLLVHLDLPVVVQQIGDHRRPDVVGRVEAALVCLLGVHPRVVYEQQYAAGRDGREQRSLGRGVWGAQQGRVLRGDQVEGEPAGGLLR